MRARMFSIIYCMLARTIHPPGTFAHARRPGTLQSVGKRRQDPKTPFGWHLRGLMDANGFESDADLAAASGVDASALSKWQSGAGTPSVDNLRKVAPHLHTRLGDLMVQADLATAEELGMKGQPPKLPPAKVDAGLREVAELLADSHIPTADKENLRGLVAEAIEYWLRRRNIPNLREPSAAERAKGKPVTRK